MHEQDAIPPEADSVPRPNELSESVVNQPIKTGEPQPVVQSSQSSAREFQDETRLSRRQEIKHTVDKLDEVLEACSITHQSLASTLSQQKELAYDYLESLRLQLFKTKLDAEKAFESLRLKCAEADVELDLKIRNKLDRVVADNAQLLEKVMVRLNNLTARSKVIDPNVSLSDAKSQSSITSSSRSKSSLSASSYTSAKLRVKQLEARASAAALQKKLRASEEAQLLEQQSQLLEQQQQQLEQQKQQLAKDMEHRKLQAEYEAALAQQEIFTQGIEEEDANALLNPPSIPGQSFKTPSYVSSNPAPSLQSRMPLNNKNVPVNTQSYHNTNRPQPQPSVLLQSSQTHNITKIQTPIPEIVYLTPDKSVHTPAKGSVAAGSPNINPVSSDQQAFANTLAQAIHTIKLKPAEPIIFFGNPLEYLDWKVSFEGLIESSSYTPLQKLALLQQYLGGKAKKVVASLFQIGTDQAFKDAKRKLDKRFGKPHILTEAYRSQLEEWPSIKDHDGEALEELVDFLESCQTAMCTLPELSCLNDRRENEKILQKLPLSIGNRWVKKATEIENNTMKFPSIADFINFLSKEARIASNSLNKALVKRATINRNTNNKSQNTKPEKRASAFLTSDTVSQQSSSSTDKDKAKQVKYPCLFCDMDNHTTGHCSKLSKQTHEIIEKLFTNNNLCYACAKPFHKMNKCRHPEKCMIRDCGKQHLTVFHDYYNESSDNRTTAPQPLDSSPNQGIERNHQQKPTHSEGSESKTYSTQPVNKLESSANSQTPATARNCADIRNRPANLKSWTIPVYVSSKENPDHEILTYALLDSGSNHTFITNDVLQKLNATTHDADMNISTLTDIDGAKSNRQAATGLLVRGYKKQKYLELPLCVSQSQIPFNRNEIPDAMSVQDWPHLQHLIPEFITAREGSSLTLGLLIGSNLPQVFMSRQEVVADDNAPFARLSDLGWLLMGNTRHHNTLTSLHESPKIVNLAVSQPITRKNISFKIQAENSRNENNNLESRILKILSSDFHSNPSDNNKMMSIDDINFLKKMKDDTYKDQEGYITMPLPLKQKPGCNRSKDMALKRFKLLQKKLQDPVYSKHYHEFMKDIIAQGDAEMVFDETDDSDNVWYIPHFGVYHPKKPGKIRVVFDGSAKVGGMCLNDCLLQGPDQMNSLIGILMRFRRELVGVTCDISRMFHQFRVSPEFRDLLRFLWFNKQGEIVTYRMKVHLFGATSSPACATYGLRELCEISQNPNNEAKAFIRENFYVDDGLISLPNSSSAQSLVHDAIAICKEGNLRLHKFSSNSPTLLSTLPVSERNIEDIRILDREEMSQPYERTLGLLWSLKTDTFEFSSNLKENPNTRRGILSTIASIYDPLGLLSPFILKGKNILQDMCRIATSWDDSLPGDLLSRWECWKASLDNLAQIQIKRCYKTADLVRISKAEIHHFSDASTCGYGAVSYLRLVDINGQVNCSLLMSKARVAPLKPITIPRMELQAAVTAADVSNVIRAELGIDATEMFWTDSQVVLGYLKNTSKKFHIYVTNRVQRIRDNSNAEQWFYVPTSQNPADHASRGMNINQLQNSNWFTGPDFLWKEPLVMPEQLTPIVRPDDPEVKSLCTHVENTSQPFTLYQRLHRFSSWKTAVKVTNTFIRKVHHFKEKTNLQDSKYNNIAINYIVRSAQQEHFPEVQPLMKGNPIKAHSSIFNLHPFIDEDGIMRVGGRLNHSMSMNFDEKHPVLMPKKGHITQILIRHFHEQVAHQGREFTLAKMRSSGYWILGARGLVASLIHKCVYCRLDRAKPIVPQMSSLPKERTSPSPPFTFCGVDCFGPFFVKDKRTELKRYGLMVTCLASRSVHIELLDDMTTSAFINSIRNVISIRGPIREIWCDQGTNFIGAIPELQEKGVLEFKLNPPSASNMGGAWERMIRTARNVLQSLLRSHGGRLDTSGLRTLMYEVMAIVNSRPISTVTEENIPLTPNQLLTMKSDIILPPPSEFEDSDIYSRKRWRAVQHLANLFWRRWKSEYLAHLQIRQKWVMGQSNVKVGNIVVIKDENINRNQWARGKVVECYKSKDGHVRSVKILLGNRKEAKLSDRYLHRPVSKLVKLIEG